MKISGRTASVAILGMALAAIFTASAYAQVSGAAPVAVPATYDIPVKPYVEFVAPYVNILVQALALALVTFAAAKLQQWSGMRVNQIAIEKLKSAAATQAGILVAAAEDNLKGRVITVLSPDVARAARVIAERLPDTAKAVGATPQALQEFVAGEVGKLQAAQPPKPLTSISPVGGPKSPMI